MKAGLKRIEATLHDLGTRNSEVTADTADVKKRPFSFRISIKPTEGSNQVNNSTESSVTDTANTFDAHVESVSNSANGEDFSLQEHPVETFSTNKHGGKTPSLPKFKTPSFSNHRHGANPALAVNILQEIQVRVSGWQRELQKIVQQIQDIYLEGPIINGWLESNPQEAEPGGTATLRHGEVDRLMNYVEEICGTGEKGNSPNLCAGYRLFGVDDAGKVWSRPCPAEQVAHVSMAIARYQRLRQLLGRKQYLETRLSQLAETLVVLHSQIQQV
jgi:hypothetical protein